MNIKRSLYLSIVFVLLTVLTYLVLSKINNKRDIENKLQEIPKFKFLTLQRSQFDNTNLEINSPIILLYFNSECSFCKDELISISKNTSKFEGVQLLLVSSENIDLLHELANKYNLKSESNILLLNDINENFSTEYEILKVPNILIYDKEHRLLKSYVGYLGIDQILNILNSN